MQLVHLGLTSEPAEARELFEISPPPAGPKEQCSAKQNNKHKITITIMYKPANFGSEDSRSFSSCRVPRFNFADSDSFLNSHSGNILYSCEISLESTVVMIIYIFDWNYLFQCVISFLYRSQSSSVCRF